MEDIACEIDKADDFDLPRKKPNQTVGFLLLLLSCLFTFHSSQFELPATIEPSSISAPAPLKAPALEANHAVKFVSRTQGAFKLANGSDDDDLNVQLQKSVVKFDAKQSLLKSKPFYQAFTRLHYQRFYTSEVQPRAPPASLT